jgi:membrane protease YdiL (CAAX protease family)
MTTTTTQQPTPDRHRVHQRIRDATSARPVASFFVLAYAFSWVGWLPVLLGAGEPIRTVSYVVGGFGPALAGAVTTWLCGGSVRAWAAQIVRWRVAPRWYLAAVLFPLLVVGLASAGISLFGPDVDPSLLPGRVTLVFSSYVFVALVGGGNEEPGWRGFALPRLQSQFAPVPATLILGVVWAFWHLPMLQGLDVYVLVRVVNIVGFAFLLTWVYNGTNSVLLALLMHAGFNTANSTLVPLPMEALSGTGGPTVLVAVTAAVWVVAVLLVVVTRGRLGYDGRREPSE